MIHHISNWTLLWFSLGGYALCWLRRDWRITRLAKTVRRLKWSLRMACADRDEALRENEELVAANRSLASQLAVAIRHPSQRRLRSVSADELRRMS